MNMVRQAQKFSGFTLIELLVVIAIMSILATVIAINSIESGKQSRDEKRQADLRTLQSAIELYKNKNGRYPAGCRGADQWAGEQGTAFACPGSDTQYIVGLAPEFISVLPVESKSGSGEYGYAYRTNADGTVYKLISMNTVESETVGYDHKFKSCDWDGSGSVDISVAGWCTNPPWNGNNTPEECKSTNSRFQTSYAVWGGFAPLANGMTSIEGLTNNQKRTAVADTSEVICK